MYMVSPPTIATFLARSIAAWRGAARRRDVTERSVDGRARGSQLLRLTVSYSPRVEVTVSPREVDIVDPSGNTRLTPISADILIYFKRSRLRSRISRRHFRFRLGDLDGIRWDDGSTRDEVRRRWVLRQ